MSTDGSPRRGGRRPGMTEERRAEETAEMLQMRQMGASYEAIARHYNLNRKTVWERVTQALRDMPSDDAAILRALEARKYDVLEAQLQAGIKEGDTKAITTAIRVSERRCRLLGLDMPERHEVKIDAETQALADQVVGALQELANLPTVDDEDA